jgi:hypothetical protein
VADALGIVCRKFKLSDPTRYHLYEVRSRGGVVCSWSCRARGLRNQIIRTPTPFSCFTAKGDALGQSPLGKRRAAAGGQGELHSQSLDDGKPILAMCKRFPSP